MDKKDIDLQNLPDPVKNILGNVDMNKIKEIVSGMDSANLNQFIDSTISKIKQNLSEKDAETFEKIAKNFVDQTIGKKE
ncbi:MAG: hypothetical protein PWQ82_183 [Thermosediminibacterales bacterium]|nr:hypothetical protein [Thermosediminibacterales bacterium]MDK2835348.1 hypothetical protein [Thermosediminibacterales bacterium]